MVDEKLATRIHLSNHHHHHHHNHHHHNRTNHSHSNGNGTGNSISTIHNGHKLTANGYKRPSSVSSSNSNESNKDTSTDWSLDTDSSGDYEYGPGIVDRLRHKFMALSTKHRPSSPTLPPVSTNHRYYRQKLPIKLSNGVNVSTLIKRCSSMEELTFQQLKPLQKQQVLRPNQIYNGNIVTPVMNGSNHNGHNNHHHHYSHQLINGTKKKLIQHMTTNGHVASKNVETSKRSTVTSSLNQTRTTAAAIKSSTSTTQSLYPTNIVKQFVQNQNAKLLKCSSAYSLLTPSTTVSTTNLIANTSSSSSMNLNSVSTVSFSLSSPSMLAATVQQQSSSPVAILSSNNSNQHLHLHNPTTTINGGGAFKKKMINGNTSNSYGNCNGVVDDTTNSEDNVCNGYNNKNKTSSNNNGITNNNNNNSNNLLLLSAPQPYIKRSKSVETLSLYPLIKDRKLLPLNLVNGQLDLVSNDEDNDNENSDNKDLLVDYTDGDNNQTLKPTLLLNGLNDLEQPVSATKIVSSFNDYPFVASNNEHDNNNKINGDDLLSLINNNVGVVEQKIDHKYDDDNSINKDSNDYDYKDVDRYHFDDKNTLNTTFTSSATTNISLVNDTINRCENSDEVDKVNKAKKDQRIHECEQNEINVNQLKDNSENIKIVGNLFEEKAEKYDENLPITNGNLEQQRQQSTPIEQPVLNQETVEDLVKEIDHQNQIQSTVDLETLTSSNNSMSQQLSTAATATLMARTDVYNNRQSSVESSSLSTSPASISSRTVSNLINELPKPDTVKTVKRLFEFSNTASVNKSNVPTKSSPESKINNSIGGSGGEKLVNKQRRPAPPPPPSSSTAGMKNSQPQSKVPKQSNSTSSNSKPTIAPRHNLIGKCNNSNSNDSAIISGAKSKLKAINKSGNHTTNSTSSKTALANNRFNDSGVLKAGSKINPTSNTTINRANVSMPKHAPPPPPLSSTIPVTNGLETENIASNDHQDLRRCKNVEYIMPNNDDNDVDNKENYNPLKSALSNDENSHKQKQSQSPYSLHQPLINNNNNNNDDNCNTSAGGGKLLSTKIIDNNSSQCSPNQNVDNNNNKSEREKIKNDKLYPVDDISGGHQDVSNENGIDLSVSKALLSSIENVLPMEKANTSNNESVAALSGDTNESNGDDNCIGAGSDAVQVDGNNGSTDEQQQQLSMQNSLASNRKSLPNINDSSFNMKSTKSSADNNEKHRTENNNNEPIKTLKPSLLSSSSSASTSLSNSPITKSTLWGTPSSHLRTKSSSGSKLVSNGCSSIVFDFRDNKNIKPNIAIQPTPFGAKPIPKRIIKELVHNNDGYDLGHNGDDEDDDEDDTNYSGLTEIPPPSGIQFKGENVIISNGSLLRKRNKNLSIRFNDSQPSIFEYPFDDDHFEDDDNDGDDETDSEDLKSNNSVSNLVNSLSSTNSSMLNGQNVLKKNSFPTGSSNLGSYKPSQIAGSSFELGKTKRPDRNTNLESGNRKCQNGNLDKQNCHLQNEDDYCDTIVKPASVEDTVKFSQSGTASDLLF